MGGSINIAARFNDGSAICIDGWTNFIPDMILNETTLSGDDSIVRKTLFEAAAHEHFDGPQRFIQSGYGMVVIDFIAREIHSKQGYTSFEWKSLAQFADLNASGWQGNPLNPLSKFHYQLKSESIGLLKAGRIYTKDDESAHKEFMSEQIILERLYDDFNSKRLSPTYHREYYIDTAPFKVFDYDEMSGFAEMKRNLTKSGFPMKKSDGLNKIFDKKD